MERLEQTKKRDSDEGGASPKRHRTTGRRFARENSDRSYVQNNRNRKVNSMQMMKAMMIQQQQLNNTFLNAVKSYLQCISDQLSKCFYLIKTDCCCCCCCIRFAQSLHVFQNYFKRLHLGLIWKPNVQKYTYFEE